jgi:diadenylate cyclase
VSAPLGFPFVSVHWRDLVQIALVAFVIYRVLLLLHGTRAVQMLTGIVMLVLAYAVAWVVKLTMITRLLGLAFTFAPIVLAIIFAPELRQALAHLGQTGGLTRFLRRLGPTEVADELVAAVDRLQHSGIGAIIAIERETRLGDYLQSGTELQAKVSADLLATIFTPYSPLHDGAVIVRGDTIIGAGCILPLSQALLSDRSLGTRHRAALGLAEESDAVVIVISEETQQVSVAVGGTLLRGLTTAQLREAISGRASAPSLGALRAPELRT